MRQFANQPHIQYQTQPIRQDHQVAFTAYFQNQISLNQPVNYSSNQSSQVYGGWGGVDNQQQRPPNNNLVMQQTSQMNVSYQNNQEVMNSQQYNQIYKEKTHRKKDLKNFKLLVNLKKNSIKTRIQQETNDLQISFEVDALADFYLRVNTCVTETRDMNNVSVQMTTPDSKNYVQEFKLKKGNISINFNQCHFGLGYIEQQNQYKINGNYIPIVFSIYYQQRGKQYAQLSYGEFTLNHKTKQITGIHIEKQVIMYLWDGTKLRYQKGRNYKKAGQDDDNLLIGLIEEGEDKVCLICLSEPRNTIIMPCGHLCVCSDCGDKLNQKNQNCPICRATISSLVPFNMNKIKKQ
eukprot:403364265